MTQDLRYLNFLAKLGKGDLHPHGKAATRRMIDALEIQNGFRLLEIGCGTGETLTRILLTHNVTADAIDVLPAMLKKASLRVKLTGLTNRVRLYNISEDDLLPFESSYYDRIYAESVLGFQTQETVTKLLRETHRILKSGCLFAANDAIWKEDTSTVEIERINRSCNEDFGLTQASPMPWKLYDWLRLFKETGFQVLSSELITNTEKSINGQSRNPGIFLSESFSKFFRIKSFLSPSLVRESQNFSRLLKKHTDDGKYIESRLFVLKKN